ncbi:MAG: NAD(P)H-dependent oxidoreductase [Propionibacteriales bacterium]|nr:NAD(P)H-dependent oxidoreductase [Propionibacteriales bacterium]
MDLTHAPTASQTLRVGVIAGSTRPTRRSPAIARWVADDTSQPTLQLHTIDLLDHDLSLLSEPTAAAFGEYEQASTRAWSKTVASYDAFVLVAAEYNASFPAALKNALDHLYAEWHHKPVGLVGYGMAGGLLAVEALRPVVAELRMHPAPTTLALSPHRVDDGRYVPADGEADARSTMLGEIATLGAATRTADEEAPA